MARTIGPASGSGPDPLAGLEPDALELERERMRHMLGAVILLRRDADRLVKLQEDVNLAAVILREAGASWSTIGEALRISRQAAQQRYRGAFDE